jgi:lipopolysaccharide transport system ATP-binding protein
MSDFAIRTVDLGKRYRLRHAASSTYATLREEIAANARRLWLRQPRARNTPDDFWAVRGITIDIPRGEVVGIIGRNGAGKSTLLKLISRIIEPTEGRITLRGRVASLLEVGTGFHPELSGRENIFLNSAILGMSKREITAKFDAIVAFAEVERFLDTAVKHYSSGMYMRLAFAVAAHLEPEILLVDEVLAVGDAEFQKKCMGKMKDVASTGRTVLFVSHTMHAVTSLCSQALLLDRGTVQYQGNTLEGVRLYLSAGLTNTASWTRTNALPARPLQLEKLSVILDGEQPRHTLSVDLILSSSQRHADAFLAIDIRDHSGMTVMQAMPNANGFIGNEPLTKTVRVTIELPPLIPGRYLVGVWLGTHHTETLDHVPECASFEVISSPTRGRTYPHYSSHGFIVPESKATLTTALSSENAASSC